MMVQIWGLRVLWLMESSLGASWGRDGDPNSLRSVRAEEGPRKVWRCPGVWWVIIGTVVN